MRQLILEEYNKFSKACIFSYRVMNTTQLLNLIFSSYQLQRAEKEMNELGGAGILDVSLEFGLQGAEGTDT